MSTQKTSGGEPTFEVDSPAQYGQIPNDTYFKDNYLGIKLYKNAQGTVINPWTANGAIVYKALLTQSGIGAPTAAILGVNSIGNIQWSRNAAGDYLGTLAGAFANASKVALSLDLNQIGDFDYSIVVATDNSIQIETTDGGISTDDVLSSALLCIEIYP